MSSSAAGHQEDSEDEVDVFVEVEKEKVIKTYSKEKAVVLLFKKRDDGENVNTDELGLLEGDEKPIKVEKPEEKKPKPPPVISFPPGSLFATAAFAVPSPKAATRYQQVRYRSLLASNSLSNKVGSSSQPNLLSQHSSGESTESTENGDTNRPKKMTFDRMILRHVPITGQGQSSSFDLGDIVQPTGKSDPSVSNSSVG